MQPLPKNAIKAMASMAKNERRLPLADSKESTESFSLFTPLEWQIDFSL